MRGQTVNAQLAQRLRQAAQVHRAGAQAATAAPELRLNLVSLLGLHGESSGAVLLMLLAVVSVFPVTGTGTVMALGIWMLAWAWTRGQDTMALPERLGRVTLNERWSGRCLHGLAWMYEQAERWMRPRWSVWTSERTRAWWGAWIGLMGLLIFLPLPLGNVLPSLSLILLSLGWMFRDGLALLLSTTAGLGALLYVASLWQLVVHGVNQVGALV